jgi:EmrB/QacA subfamily drug resistance transporter
MQSTKRYVLIATTLGAFLIPFMGSAINIALPKIADEFKMPATLQPWVTTSYLIAAAAFLVPFGKLSDIYGRKRIFAVGTLVFSLSSLMAALSTSSDMLMASRVIQGISGAMIFGTSIALLLSVYPAEERGRVLGINVASTYFGLSIGPFIGGIMTDHFGWRSIFYLNIPLGLIAFTLLVWKLKEDWAASKGERFDIPGAIIYVLMLIAITYGLASLPATVGICLFVGGMLAIAAFVKWELRAKNPVLDIKLFRNNLAFAMSNVAALINYSATYALAFLLSLYLQYIKGFTAEKAGFILVTQPVVQAIFSPLAGKLSDRVEPRILASIGMALSAVGLALYIFLSNGTSLGYIIGGQVLLGFGFALFSSPNTNAVMSSVENRYYGVASSTVATMRQVGMTLSMGIAAVLFAVYIGKVQITPPYYDAFLKSVKVAFIIFSCLCVAGVFASLARGKVSRKM